MLQLRQLIRWEGVPGRGWWRQKFARGPGGHSAADKDGGRRHGRAPACLISGTTGVAKWFEFSGHASSLLVCNYVACGLRLECVCDRQEQTASSSKRLLGLDWKGMPVPSNIPGCRPDGSPAYHAIHIPCLPLVCLLPAVGCLAFLPLAAHPSQGCLPAYTRQQGFLPAPWPASTAHCRRATRNFVPASHDQRTISSKTPAAKCLTHMGPTATCPPVLEPLRCQGVCHPGPDALSQLSAWIEVPTPLTSFGSTDI